MMSEKQNFKLHLSVAPVPFFFNFPNVAYHGNDHNNHLPTIVERRLTDLGDKYFLTSCAFRKIISITQIICDKYDSAENELKVGEDYWELVLMLNHFLFEARSSLDILAAVLRYMHGKHTPQSFNDIDETGKHAKIFDGDRLFYDHLVEAKNSEWIHYLLSRSGKTSLRDRATHYTVARINISPNESMTGLGFRIAANLKAEHPMQANNGLELIGTVTAIMVGMDKLLSGFKDNYTQKRIRGLLNIDPATPGLYENQ